MSGAFRAGCSFRFYPASVRVQDGPSQLQASFNPRLKRPDGSGGADAGTGRTCRMAIAVRETKGRLQQACAGHFRMQRLMRAHGNTELTPCATFAEPFQAFRARGQDGESLFSGFVVFRFRRQGAPALALKRKRGAKRTEPQGGSQKIAAGENSA